MDVSNRKSLETLSGVNLYASQYDSGGFSRKAMPEMGNCRAHGRPQLDVSHRHPSLGTRIGPGQGQKLDPMVAGLWIATPLAASLSFCVVLAALASPYWLITVERMPNPLFNGTDMGGDAEEEGGAYLAKRTSSGLWTLCATSPGDKKLVCSYIDYFPGEEYSPDPEDSTMAIPYAVTRSSLFFLSAGLLLAGAYVCCLVGICMKHRRLYVFIAGVLFVVSGLLMLIGLIMYISVFKAEVGSKLRARSTLQPPMFTFRYGYGFLLYVCGFVLSELTGTAAVFFYIHWHQSKYQRERFRVRKSMHSSLDYLSLDHAVRFPCRRHPQAHVDCPSPARQRRYYFEKEPASTPCSIHRNRPLSASLRDMDITFIEQNVPYPPCPPSAFGSAKSVNHCGSRTFPRDATTNTISTTVADVNTCDDYGLDDYSPSIQHEFVTFDLDHPIRSPSWSDIPHPAGFRREFSLDTLRRTTPV